MVRLATAVALFVMLMLAALPAWAHVEVSPVEVPEASEQELVFSFHHGCDGAATDGLQIQLPEGVEVTAMGGPPGWQSTVDTSEGSTVVVFSGPPVPDGEEASFPIQVTLPPGGGSTLYFPAIQKCGPDAAERWVEIPEEGQNPEELVSPAPAVTLLENPDATTSTMAEPTTTPTTGTTAATTTTTTATTTTTTVATTTTTAPPATTSPATTVAAAGTGGGGPAGGTVALVAAGAAALAVGGVALARRGTRR